MQMQVNKNTTREGFLSEPMLEEHEIRPAAKKSNDFKAGLHGFSCMTRPAVPTNLDRCSCGKCCNYAVHA